MASEAVSRDAGDAAAETGGEERPVTRWPRWRIRHVASRAVLAVGGLCTVMLLALLLACFLDDRAIESSRGTAVAEVLETSWTRTIVRFNTDDGRVFIPPGGVLYPSGLQEGQQVWVEFDKQNPDLVRVAGRDMTVALLPVFTTMAGVWVVLLPVYWLLRRGAHLPASSRPAR